MPVFELIGISLTFNSLLNVIAHNTGSPVPEMKGSTVKCRLVVAPASAAASPLFFRHQVQLTTYFAIIQLICGTASFVNKE
jgi:hypothetical protein